MPKLRVESGFSITIPIDVVQTLRLRVGRSIEIRFPEMPIPMERGLGTATQWRHLANQRLEDAQVLIASRKRRYNGAVYLGGYTVECALKSAICALKNLPNLPEDYKTHMLDELLTATGLTLPDNLVMKFCILRDWTVELRYQTKILNAQDARKFLQYANEVKQWLESETSPK
ncbi:HEPN domain-containing protein [bacterium]|nr:HEPN domain-containing protein [bacterium]